MKRIVLGGVMALAIAGTVLAQGPQPLVSGASSVGSVSATNAAGDPPSDRPCCAVPLTTVCVPEATTKVVTTPMYSRVCEPLCFPKWSLSLGFHRCEDACPNCEHPRTKYYLVVRTRTEERPAVVCKPVLVEACSKACGGIAGAGIGTEGAIPTPVHYVPRAETPIPAPTQRTNRN